MARVGPGTNGDSQVGGRFINAHLIHGKVQTERPPRRRLVGQELERQVGDADIRIQFHLLIGPGRGIPAITVPAPNRSPGSATIRRDLGNNRIVGLVARGPPERQFRVDGLAQVEHRHQRQAGIEGEARHGTIANRGVPGHAGPLVARGNLVPDRGQPISPAGQGVHTVVEGIDRRDRVLRDRNIIDEPAGVLGHSIAQRAATGLRPPRRHPSSGRSCVRCQLVEFRPVTAPSEVQVTPWSRETSTKP